MLKTFIAQKITVAFLTSKHVVFVSGTVSTQAHDAQGITSMFLFVVVCFSTFETKVAAFKEGSY